MVKQKFAPNVKRDFSTRYVWCKANTTTKLLSARGFLRAKQKAKKYLSIVCLSTMWVFFSIWPVIAHSQQYDLSHFIIIAICQLGFVSNHWMYTKSYGFELWWREKKLLKNKCSIKRNVSQKKKQKKRFNREGNFDLNDICIWLVPIKCKILLAYVCVCAC